jgi:SpoVK/Ycf46/Vps4 family AAA+-type ATPase
VRANWDDLIIPDLAGERMLELVERVRARHRLADEGLGRKQAGVAATIGLFAGAPGTGKSMAAGLVAGELSLVAWQISLRQLVATWDAQTDRELGAAFALVDAGHVLIVLDEAEVLATPPAARVAVQVIDLLRRSSGIAILTMAEGGRLDASLGRLVQVETRFPLPDEPARALLWARALPRGSNLDARELAKRPGVSGARIADVMVRATLLAEAAGEPLSLRLIRLALEREPGGPHVGE